MCQLTVVFFYRKTLFPQIRSKSTKGLNFKKKSHPVTPVKGNLSRTTRKIRLEVSPMTTVIIYKKKMDRQQANKAKAPGPNMLWGGRFSGNTCSCSRVNKQTMMIDLRNRWSRPPLCSVQPISFLRLSFLASRY